MTFHNISVFYLTIVSCMPIHKIIQSTLNVDNITVTMMFGLFILYCKFVGDTSLIYKIVVTAFVVAIYDLFLKKMLLLDVTDNYYIFALNNVITIVTIDFLVHLIRRGEGHKRDCITYFNIAFACLFYEFIVYKMYDYNAMCSEKLRESTKTVMRLMTVHILGEFLNGADYDKQWFDTSIAQIFNFGLFESAFEND
jgi:hypothetical protein